MKSGYYQTQPGSDRLNPPRRQSGLPDSDTYAPLSTLKLPQGPCGNRCGTQPQTQEVSAQCRYSALPSQGLRALLRFGAQASAWPYLTFPQQQQYSQRFSLRRLYK